MRACSSHPFGKTGLKVAKSFVFITSSLLAQCARIKSILLDQDWFQCLAVSFLAFVKTCPHPEVCPSAPEFGYQWIALVSSKLDNVVAVIFCRGLMSAPSHTFEIRWDAFCFWECISFLIFEYFWLNVSSLKIRPCHVNLNLRSLWKCICTNTMKWSIEGWGGKSSEREIGLESRFSIWDLLHWVHGGFLFSKLNLKLNFGTEKQGAEK